MINYILVKQHWHSSIHDTRAYWCSIDTAKSDHALVVSKIKLHFKITRPKTKALRFKTHLLKLPNVCNQFNAVLESKLQNLDNSSVNEICSSIKDSIIKTASQVLGKKHQTFSAWISSQTLDLIQRRHLLPRHLRPERSLLDKEIKMSLKNDRENYWSSIASKMEFANAVGDSRQLYQLIRQASGKNPSHISGSINDPNGNSISNTKDKLTCWKDHFCKVLNPEVTNNHQILPEIDLNTETFDCNILPPSTNEIISAIDKLRANKAAGEDELIPEFFKASKHVIVNHLKILFDEIWKNESIPSSWSCSVLIPIFKKGSPSECCNYRGISLLDIGLKILESVLLNRFKDIREQHMRENQAGFRSGRGCVDQIFTLRLILSNRHEFLQPSIVTFVDFKSAFDSISRDSLWNIMFNKGIPQKLINVFKGIYAKTSATVHVYNDNSEPFDILSGVRQGAIASPVLFNFIIDWVMEKAVSHCYNNNISIGFPATADHITDLGYADDLALLSQDETSMQFFLDSVVYFGSQVGLIVNPSKCKVLHSSVTCPNLLINGNALENVDNFCYLARKIASDGGSDNDINIRIGKASSVFNSLKNCLFSRSDISLQLKFRVFCASVRSVLLYGCES